MAQLIHRLQRENMGSESAKCAAFHHPTDDNTANGIQSPVDSQEMNVKQEARCI